MCLAELGGGVLLVADVTSHSLNSLTILTDTQQQMFDTLFLSDPKCYLFFRLCIQWVYCLQVSAWGSQLQKKEQFWRRFGISMRGYSHNFQTKTLSSMLNDFCLLSKIYEVPGCYQNRDVHLTASEVQEKFCGGGMFLACTHIGTGGQLLLLFTA